MSADELKAQGNAAFSAKDYTTAIEYFTKAIEASPTPNHVLYSNRSACYASLKQFPKALDDAEKCVSINASWSKGYNRVGNAQYGLGNLEDAGLAYTKALQLDPQNKAAQDGLAQVQEAEERRNAAPDLGLGQIFNDPMLIEKLKTNPKTAELMKDPSLVAKVLQFKSNPQSMGLEMMQDPRMMTILATMMGIDLNSDAPVPGQSASEPAPAAAPAAAPSSTPAAAPSSTPASTPAAATSAQAEPVAEPVDEARAEADAAKAEGNKLYKARKFDEAIAMYNKAWELCQDITYLNNRSAAEFEKGDYETTIKTAQQAVECGREMRADYKIIAKSFARIASAYSKMDNLTEAVVYYQKSLTEHRTPDVLAKLRNAEKELKVKEATSYIDPAKAEEARLEGKEHFTKGDWPNAVKAYTEMIKRAPEDARGYSNRAAALAKLMSFPEAIKDCEVAISKDSTFIRAYIRKATAEIAIRNFNAALETLDLARTKDAEINQGANANEINQLYLKASSSRFGPLDGETEEQARNRAMQDPEVMAILQDPVMQTILSQAQSNPAALQEHMRNPDVYKKINTLIAAGIIRTR